MTHRQGHRRQPASIPGTQPATRSWGFGSGPSLASRAGRACNCPHRCAAEGTHARHDRSVFSVLWTEGDAGIGWFWSDSTGGDIGPFLTADAAYLDACDTGGSPDDLSDLPDFI